MQAQASLRAMAAARSVASSLGLAADDARILHNSNRLAIRLLPCDVLARVATGEHHAAEFEVDLVQRLVEAGCPTAPLDPRIPARVYYDDGFSVTLWTYYPPQSPPELAAADYADALARLHAGMRKVDPATPHFTDRVQEAQDLIADPERTPALSDPDRDLLDDALRTLSRRIADNSGAEQLLHGEPHPGNLLNTQQGPLFIDLETCCRGPVEFDLAHAPEEVGELYPGADRELLRDCRTLVQAIVTTWRWDRLDEFPNGRRLGIEWLSQLRAMLS